MVLGIAELAAGTFGLLGGLPFGGFIVAAFYGLFFTFIVIALVRDLPIQSCGCLGRSDTPPTVIHAVANAAAALGATWFALSGQQANLVDVLRDQPLAGVPYLALLLSASMALGLMFTALPRLDLLVRSPR